MSKGTLLYLVAALSVARIQAGGFVQIGFSCWRIQTGLSAEAQVPELIKKVINYYREHRKYINGDI